MIFGIIRWFNPTMPMYQNCCTHCAGLLGLGQRFHQWVLLIKAWLEGKKSPKIGKIKKKVQGGHSGFLSPLSYSCKVRHTIICHMLYSYSEGSQLELSLCLNKGARFSSSQFSIFLGTSLTEVVVLKQTHSLYILFRLGGLDGLGYGSG